MANQYAPEPMPEALAESSARLQIYHAPSPPPPQPANEEDPMMFFVALKDGWIYTATAYWVQGKTLHYITTQGEHNQVSLDLVDRQTSAKLNEGRRVELRLPGAK
jgi:hypothetical protein